MAQTTPTVTTPTVTTPSVTTPQNVVEASRASQARANIEAMDKNGDGKISRDEWKGSTEVFNRLDANHDGFITPDERPKIERPAAGQTTGTRGQAPASQTKDTNKDGKIEKDEWKGRPAVFNRLDANHDGAIEKGEPRAAAASRGRRR
jgi:Ca2+-binding EF-hand superfamily protein